MFSNIQWTRNDKNTLLRLFSRLICDVAARRPHALGKVRQSRLLSAVASASLRVRGDDARLDARAIFWACSGSKGRCARILGAARHSQRVHAAKPGAYHVWPCTRPECGPTVLAVRVVCWLTWRGRLRRTRCDNVEHAGHSVATKVYLRPTIPTPAILGQVLPHATPFSRLLAPARKRRPETGGWACSYHHRVFLLSRHNCTTWGALAPVGKSRSSSKSGASHAARPRPPPRCPIWRRQCQAGLLELRIGASWPSPPPTVRHATCSRTFEHDS